MPVLLFHTQVIHDPDQKLLIMVMEFMPGGSILSSSRLPGLTTEPLPEPAARNYFR
jgi:serine/threonine protein kinase